MLYLNDRIKQITEKNKVKLLFASDVCFNYLSLSSKPCDKATSEAAMKEPRELFRAADFSMLNLENIFGIREENEPIIKAGPNLISEDRFINYINALSPTAIGLANNHTKDFGEPAMLHTLELLRGEGYTCIGAGKNIDEAYLPAEFSKDGISVSVIAVCENEFGIADREVSGTAGYNITRVTKAIFSAKEKGSLPIIYFHGGNEINPFPSPGKIDLYRHFIDIGAVAVIAMHTHCPQGYEIYDGKPIVYSMGNFFFPPRPNPDRKKSWFYGYMSGLEIDGEGVELTTYPYVFDENGIKLLSGEEKEYFDRYISRISRDIKDPVIMRDLFDSWCLTQGYIDTLTDYTVGMLYTADPFTARSMRNNFSCEAHNELLTNSFKMMYEERVQRAIPGKETIAKLQDLIID